MYTPPDFFLKKSNIEKKNDGQNGIMKGQQVVGGEMERAKIVIGDSYYIYCTGDH